MAMSNVLSAYGTIEKREYVRDIKIKSLKKYFILESVDPFPEAHIRHKSSFVKFYFVPMMPERMDQDINISAQSAEGQILGEVASALGEIKIRDKSYDVLRLRNVSENALPRLIKAYEYEGINIYPFEEHVHEYAWIHVKKFFHLEEIEEGIFTDLDDPYIGYLKVPGKLEWEELETLTQSVKKDVHYPNFDKALGTIYKGGEPVEVVRIFSPDMTEDVLKEISESFGKYFSSL
ncbi:MAG: hypothetical protein K9H65_01125 [Bacteroidales bacterium]|nr:hypothetical protein [Bacteroidales bacterium]